MNGNNTFDKDNRIPENREISINHKASKSPQAFTFCNDGMGKEVRNRHETQRSSSRDKIINWRVVRFRNTLETKTKGQERRVIHSPIRYIFGRDETSLGKYEKVENQICPMGYESIKSKHPGCSNKNISRISQKIRCVRQTTPIHSKRIHSGEKETQTNNFETFTEGDSRWRLKLQI